MSKTVLILGNSGVGKSTSIRTLNPDETFIINVLNKPLPFKNASKFAVKNSEDLSSGNHYATHDPVTISRVIKRIDSKRPDIKNLIIDDYGYVITQSYMAKSLDKDWAKYTLMAKEAWQIITDLTQCRDDLCCFVMMHSQADSEGVYRPKTIGKLLDEKVCLEGMVSMVMHAIIVEGQFKFLTQNNGNFLAKSPMSMFETKLIDNDLQFVRDKIEAYYTTEFTQDINQ